MKLSETNVYAKLRRMLSQYIEQNNDLPEAFLLNKKTNKILAAEMQDRSDSYSIISIDRIFSVDIKTKDDLYDYQVEFKPKKQKKK